jgi:hypothetical protein
MKTLKFSLIFGLSILAHAVFAQLKVTIRTGGDDLRSGQAAYIQLLFRNGSVSQEFDLNRGGGWGNNSVNTKSFSIEPSVRIENITSVRIRYDGTPHRFGETYDNWNVDRLTVSLNGTSLAECSGVPWHRFTGETRTKDCKATPPQSYGSFIGCWNTLYERCVKPDVGSNFTVVALPNAQLMGYYKTGGGYLLGNLSSGGKVWQGKWYSTTCVRGQAVWCDGTFRFELTGLPGYP